MAPALAGDVLPPPALSQDAVLPFLIEVQWQAAPQADQYQLERRQIVA